MGKVCCFIKSHVYVRINIIQHFLGKTKFGGTAPESPGATVSGVGAGDTGDASAPPKVLICRKLGENLKKS